MSSPAAEQARGRPSRSGWPALAAAGLLPLAVYVATLTPSVLDDDPADLARQAYTLGLAYAPGYALNAMVGRAVTACVPFGPKAWRANLAAALLAAASLALGCAILRRWGVPPVPAVAAMWLLALSPLFWSQALAINAFIMAVAFAMATILLLDVWSQRRKLGWLAAASAVFGLGLSSHPSFVLFTPAVGLFVLATLWREGWKRLLAGLAVGGAAGLAGCIPWLGYTSYWVLRAPPPEAVGDSFVERLVVFLTAAEGRSDWSMYLTAIFWKEHTGRLALHAARTFAQFSIGGAVLTLAGLAALWRRRRAGLLLLAVGYAAQMNFATTIDNWHHFDIYRLSSYALLALVMGVGLGAVWTWAAKPARQWLLCGALAALTVGPAYAVLSAKSAEEAPASSAQVPFRGAFARDVEADAIAALEQAPPGSVVVASWMRFATLRFLQQVEGRGAQVTLFWSGVTVRSMLDEMALRDGGQRVLYYVRPGHDEELEELLAVGWNQRVFVGRMHELYEIPLRR